MNPELLKLLREANAGRKKGYSEAKIDAWLKTKGAPTHAALLKMAKDGPKSKPMPVTMLDQLHSAASGATLSGFDALVGLFDPPNRMGEAPGQLGKALKERGRRYAEENPGADLSARIGGGAALGLATSGMFPGAAAPLTRAAVSSGMGAGMGGVQAGFESEAETPREFGGDVARGAGLGAMFGLGGSAAAELATGGLPALGRLGQSLVAPEAAGAAAGRATIQNAAEAAGLGQSEFLGIMESLEGARPGLPVPADARAALGRQLRANVNDASGNIDDVLQSTAARAEGSADRMVADARRFSGVGRKSPAVAEREAGDFLRSEQKRMYGPLEDKYKILPDDNTLRKITKNIDAKPYWNKVRPQGGKGLPGFIHYQNFAQRLEGGIEAAKRSGDTGAMRSLIDQKRALTDRMKELMPEYVGVDKANAQLHTMASALDDGAYLYRSANGEEAAETLARIRQEAGPYADRAVYNARIGMVNALAEDLLSKAGSPSAGGQFVAPAGTLRGRARVVQALFPEGEGAFEAFVRAAAADDKIAATSAAVRGGSTTTQQLSDLQRVKEFLKMDLGSIVPKAAQRAKANTISELLAGRKTAEVADILKPRRFPGLQPGIAASGAAPAGLSLMDYLEQPR